MEKQTRLSKIDIPSYTFSQERFNSLSHFLGVPIGIIVIAISTALYVKVGIALSYFIGLLVFGVSIIALYLVSAIYHGENPANEKQKKMMRIVDHCTIFVLIAGTYTPICLYMNNINTLGLVILIIQWVLAVIGIIINIVDLTNPAVKSISMFLYLAMGWMILFSGGFTYLPMTAFAFILSGGIAYTLGSILYGIGHKNLTFHSVFHVFVFISTILQAIGIISLFN